MNIDDQHDVTPEEEGLSPSDASLQDHASVEPTPPSPSTSPYSYRPQVDITPFMAKMKAVQDEADKVLIGQDELIELILIGIVSGGHILLEGVPGIAKTLSAKVISKTLDTAFTRIQFTPDLSLIHI